MKRILFSTFIGLLLVVPALSFAQIVPCDGAIGIGGDANRVCQGCHLVQLGQNIITFLIEIIAFGGAVVFAIGGLRMVMSRGNTGEVEAAKSMMTNVVIGLVILLAGWLVIDTVLKVFVKGNEDVGGVAQIQGYGPWNQIECVTQPTLAEAPTPTPGVVVVPPTPGVALNTQQITEKYGTQISTYCQSSPIPNCSNVVAALIAAESGGKPSATSQKGALGLMQLLPENGGVNCDSADTACINSQIQKGIQYMSNSYNTTKDTTLMLASYNGGKAAILPSGCCPSGLAYQCPYDCGERKNYKQCTTLDSICTANTGFIETRNYVSKICSAIGGC